MLKTVRGRYRDGAVTLLETLDGVQESQVLVTFLTEPKFPDEHKQMVFGQFSGAILPTEEDFRIAEWRGENETEILDGR